MQWSVSINAMWKKQSKDLDTLFRDGASRLFSHPLTCQWWSSSRHPPCLLVWYQHCWNDSGYQTGLLKEFRKILSKTQTRVRKQSSGDKESVPLWHEKLTDYKEPGSLTCRLRAWLGRRRAIVTMQMSSTRGQTGVLMVAGHLQNNNLNMISVSVIL